LCACIPWWTDTHTDANSITVCNPDKYAYAYTNAYCYPNSYPNSYADSNPKTYSYSEGPPNAKGASYAASSSVRGLVISEK
jgi:hypothetical protein